MEIERLKNNLALQKQRYTQLISSLSNQLREKEKQFTDELEKKHKQFNKILRALYLLEAKLKREKKFLQEQIFERDKTIKTQREQLEKLGCKFNLLDSDLAVEKANDSSPINIKNDNKPDLIKSIDEREIASHRDDSEVSSHNIDKPPSEQLTQSQDNKLNGKLVGRQNINKSIGGNVGSANKIKELSWANSTCLRSQTRYQQIINSNILHNKHHSSSFETAAKEKSEFDDTRSIILDKNDKSQLVNSSPTKFPRDNNISSGSGSVNDVFFEGENRVIGPSPSGILQEVTKNCENQLKINGPVLNCVKAILLSDRDRLQSIKEGNNIRNNFTSASSLINSPGGFHQFGQSVIQADNTYGHDVAEKYGAREAVQVVSILPPKPDNNFHNDIFTKPFQYQTVTSLPFAPFVFENRGKQKQLWRHNVPKNRHYKLIENSRRNGYRYKQRLLDLTFLPLEGIQEADTEDYSDQEEQSSLFPGNDERDYNPLEEEGEEDENEGEEEEDGKEEEDEKKEDDENEEGYISPCSENDDMIPQVLRPIHESRIVQTVSALLMNSLESDFEFETTQQCQPPKSPTVSEMVEKFENYGGGISNARYGSSNAVCSGGYGDWCAANSGADRLPHCGGGSSIGSSSSIAHSFDSIGALSPPKMNLANDSALKQLDSPIRSDADNKLSSKRQIYLDDRIMSSKRQNSLDGGKALSKRQAAFDDVGSSSSRQTCLDNDNSSSKMRIFSDEKVNLPSKRQICCQDEMDLSSTFEEFHLVDKEIDFTYEDKVKEKNLADLPKNNNRNVEGDKKIFYEKFLENTGLSEKSILTPSRTLRNHRNVVKPGDVKYRNRRKTSQPNEILGRTICMTDIIPNS